MAIPIKSYVCQTKCFFQNRVWKVGESLQLPENIKPPKHFVDKAAFKADPKTTPPSDPRSFAEWQKREQEEARRAVGHGKPKAEIAGLPKRAEDPFQ